MAGSVGGDVVVWSGNVLVCVWEIHDEKWKLTSALQQKLILPVSLFFKPFGKSLQPDKEGIKKTRSNIMNWHFFSPYVCKCLCVSCSFVIESKIIIDYTIATVWCAHFKKRRNWNPIEIISVSRSHTHVAFASFGYVQFVPEQLQNQQKMKEKRNFLMFPFKFNSICDLCGLINIIGKGENFMRRLHVLINFLIFFLLLLLSTHHTNCTLLAFIWQRFFTAMSQLLINNNQQERVSYLFAREYAHSAFSVAHCTVICTPIIA